MLAVNPIEGGTALGRLWQSYSEQGKTAELLSSIRGVTSFASELVLGASIAQAATAGRCGRGVSRAHRTRCMNPLPLLALAHWRKVGRHRSGERLAGGLNCFLKEATSAPDRPLMDLGDEWLSVVSSEHGRAAV